MTPWALIPLAALLAGPADSALLTQREAALRAAAQVSEARHQGARRGEINQLMSTYRQAAEALEALEREAASQGAQGSSANLSAQITLGQALAEGRRDDASRQHLAAWLGEPASRLRALESAVNTAKTMAPGPVKEAILLDVIDQAQALALALRYDAALAEALSAQLTQRARGLERSTLPGQGSGAAGAAEGRRLREEAKTQDARHDDLLLTATKAATLRDTAQGLLEQRP